MGLKKSRMSDENGYLLMESLVTLSMILTIILIIYPLITDWLLLREAEKEKVEYARILYEESMQWPETLITSEGKNYTVQVTDSNLKIFKQNQTIGVDIYEIEFE